MLELVDAIVTGELGPGERLPKETDFAEERKISRGVVRESMRGLEEPVTVSAYFSEDLPPPYASNARYVRDLAVGFGIRNVGLLPMLIEGFVDPLAGITGQTHDPTRPGAALALRRFRLDLYDLQYVSEAFTATVTSIRSNTFSARSSTSRWPSVMGSNVPG